MSEKKLGEYRNGRKNLIAAILFSIPGPLFLAVSMAGGTSATQTVDLMRRSCDLLSVFLALDFFSFRYGKKLCRHHWIVQYFILFDLERDSNDFQL